MKNPSIREDMSITKSKVFHPKLKYCLKPIEIILRKNSTRKMKVKTRPRMLNTVSSLAPIPSNYRLRTSIFKKMKIIIKISKYLEIVKLKINFLILFFGGW